MVAAHGHGQGLRPRPARARRSSDSRNMEQRLGHGVRHCQRAVQTAAARIGSISPRNRQQRQAGRLQGKSSSPSSRQQPQPRPSTGEKGRGSRCEQHVRVETDSGSSQAVGEKRHLVSFCTSFLKKHHPPQSSTATRDDVQGKTR